MSRAIIKRFFEIGTCWAASIGLSCICSCSLSTLSIEGGGSRGGNPVVSGTFVWSHGEVAQNVRVTLVTQDYNPMTDPLPRLSSMDTTDSAGSFSIKAPDSGWYNVEAVGILNRERSIQFNVKVVRDSICVLPVDTLLRPGAIMVPIPEGSDTTDVYVYVPGTSIAAWLAGARDTVVLDSVPAGTIPVLYYAKRSDMERKALRHDITVRPDETTLIGNPQWSYCRRIILNTSPAGAGVKSDICGFPVLIRLNAGNYDFTQARSDGGDLMFTGKGNARLPCEIERWDAAIRRAEIWVRVDTIRGDDSVQSIIMYWGNPDATGRPACGTIFDTAGGFQGVWHLGDAAGDSVRDATANRYLGISPESARPSVTEGVIGNCREFNGNSMFITIPNTASGKLDFPQNGRYTISVWVMADTLSDPPQSIVSKGRFQYFLWLKAAYWQFTSYNDGAGWDISEKQATGRQWVLLTGVRDGAVQRLFINGEPTSTYFAPSTDETPVAGGDLVIGRANNANDGYFFSGGIDEVRVEGAVRDGDWIKLCYMNQRSDDRLIVFK